MSTKRTKGQWRAAHITGNSIMGPLDYWEVRAEDILVCSLWKRSVDEQQANARLIAAAPELLAALQSALCALEVCGKSYDYTMDKGRAAIRKALGEEK